MKKLSKILIVTLAMLALSLIVMPNVDASAAAKCFNSGNLTYQITGKNTCTVKGLTKAGKNSTSCNIPSTVTCNGKTYNVTAISDKAFCNNDNLKTVKCSNSIKSIGKQAFYDCDSLKNVTIGKNCNSLKSNAFSNCNSLKNINCSSVIKSLGSNCFGNATCNVNTR